MASAYTIIASIIAYSAGVGPSKNSSYDVSAAMSFAAVVKRRNSQTDVLTR